MSTLRSNINKFYLHRIFSSLIFSVPILVLFWKENGLSLTQIMLLQSIFAILSVVLEIPTGYYADMRTRKESLVLASVSSFLGVLTYSLGENFMHFLIGELFFALAIALSSGTLSAFLFDTLEDLGETVQFKSIWGNALFYSMLGLGIANIIGGLLAEIGLRYAVYASVPFLFALIPLSLSLTEPNRHKLVISKGYTSELISIIKYQILKNQKLKWIIIYSGIVFAFNQSALWLYQPYFQKTGLEVAYFGFVFGGFQLVAGISSKYAYRVENWLGKKASLASLIFLVSLSYFLMEHFVYLFSFSFCFIQQFVRGFKKVVVDDFINQVSSSETRATLLSAESFFARLVYAIILPFIGWSADAYGLLEAIFHLAITSLTCGVILLLYFNKRLRHLF